jgi:hypothetical protein
LLAERERQREKAREMAEFGNRNAERRPLRANRKTRQEELKEDISVR